MYLWLNHKLSIGQHCPNQKPVDGMRIKICGYLELCVLNETTKGMSRLCENLGTKKDNKK